MLYQQRSMRWSLIVAGLLISSAAAFAQDAALVGTITDQTGSSVAGATVTAKNTQTGVERHVEKDLAFPAKPPGIFLKARPAWMSDLVAQQIATQVAPRGAHSAFDHDMLVEITRMLKTNPWIMNVRGVRRVYGNAPGDTLEIDCDFRTPAALVRTGNA